MSHRIELFFSEATAPKLEQLRFWNDIDQEWHEHLPDGDFALEALAILVLRSVARPDEIVFLSGDEGSAADILDRTVSNSEKFHLFGSNLLGTPLIHDILRRLNSGRRASDSVHLFVDTHTLPLDSIAVSVERRDVSASEELEWIADNLEIACFPPTSNPNDPDALIVPIHHSEWKLLRTDFTIFQDIENNRTHITRDFVAQNIGQRPLGHRFSSVTYACADQAVEYVVTSLDDPALQWSCAERRAERAKLLIRFSRPVAPGETIRYRIALTVPNTDGLDSFHEYVAKTPCDHFSIQVVYPQTHRFVSAIATAEQHGVFSWKDLPDPVISHNGDNLTTVDWHSTNIRTGVKYRLAWSVKKDEVLPAASAGAPRPTSSTNSLTELNTLDRRHLTPKLRQ